VASVICSTCGPPCEQLLTAVGTGAGSSIIGRGDLVLSCPRPVFVLCLVIHCCRHCHSPPCCCPCCCHLCHPPPCYLSSPVAILLPVVPIPISPHSHPTSSCPWQWSGAMWWWLSLWCHVTASASVKTHNCELLRAQELKTLGLG
jgi:hypothetical protein